jgi:hypothetical protein
MWNMRTRIGSNADAAAPVITFMLRKREPEERTQLKEKKEVRRGPKKNNDDRLRCAPQSNAQL